MSPKTPTPACRSEPAPTKPIEEDRQDVQERKRNAGGGPGGGDLHPFIVGLLQTLPSTKDEWKAADRAEWLQAAAQVFKLIYKGDSDGTVTVAFKKNEDGNAGSSAS